jgi:hypothetical protein
MNIQLLVHRKRTICANLLALVFFCLSLLTFGQINRKGEIPSIRYGIELQESNVRVGGIDFDMVRIQDLESDKDGLPYRFAILLPVDLSPVISGTWTRVPGVGRIWSILIQTEGALAVAPYFDEFYIPPGGELYVYDPVSKSTLGAYTNLNNSASGYFSTELLAGQTLKLEYFEPYGTGALKLHISDIAYAYRGIGHLFQGGDRGFGDSGACEVNIICEEGNNWQDEKKGVVRISTRIGSSAFWCSGSLLNNARQDFEPYVLTADHCAFFGGNYASEGDLNQWVFYFNYESPACSDPLIEPDYTTMVGATLVAHGGTTGQTGSDFYLIELKNQVPAAVNPYFNGWDRRNNPAPNGVTIHHPQGDVKKISTFTDPVVSSQFEHNGIQSHWRVTWSETENGFGVTEGGSSGSPLFSEEGFVVGSLTGGESSCSNTGGPDYYGKFSYHWESNGDEPSSRLSDWLDPDKTGVLTLQGSYYSNIAIADFTADSTEVPVNGSLSFVDISTGRPTSWKWEFEGGDPFTSIDQNPSGIKYASYGQYNVKLIVANEIGSDTLLRKDYIHVQPVISPNPSTSSFMVFLGKVDTDNIECNVYDPLGKEIPFYLGRPGQDAISIDLGGRPEAIYYLQVHLRNDHSTSRLVLIR